MHKIKKQYFPYLVKDLNLLILGEKELTEFNEVFKYFNKKMFLEMTPFNIENLKSFIMTNSIQVVIVNSLASKEELVHSFEQIIHFQDLKIGVCCYLNDTNRSEGLINISDFSFTPNVSEDQLLSKLYNNLQTSGDVHSDSKSSQSEKSSKSAYRDAFEIDVMLISEELYKVASRIDEGDISDEVFESLHKNISKVAQIVNGYMMSSDTIKKFIKAFDKYLTTFDRTSVSIENIDGFEYLARLVEDIALFLDKYFIEKAFDDIYVVEDSLKSSFKFMRDTFEGVKPKEEDSPMEFF